MTEEAIKTLSEIVEEAETELQCNCDLDNWEPEKSTGHSLVCRIHKTAVTRYANERQKEQIRKYRKSQ